ncbi:hypothetical protein LSG31_07320 [Fodinisporobacter ferrooxydans]|uniref:Uncharacterized protein n=1 Tax=Fodinisporobacter ferrooxydans TaxID=2901836 RepID=A0ABY4CNQ3_9BACL|nr:hypothetical protein LSG31_07320 [Alicyclobacillaceae bacterium MYW30-H2]
MIHQRIESWIMGMAIVMTAPALISVMIETFCPRAVLGTRGLNKIFGAK